MTKKKIDGPKKSRGATRMRELGKQVYTPAVRAKTWRGANAAGVDLFKAWPLPPDREAEEV